MKKRLSIIGIALMLAFYPTFAFAAETSQNEVKAQEKNELSDDANVSVEKADVDKQADQDDASTDKEESVEEVDSVDSDEGSKEENADTDAEKEVETAIQDEEADSSNNNDKTDNHQEDAKQQDEESVVAEEASSEEEEVTEDEQEVEEEASEEQADEDLDLDKIHGSANGKITFDFNKGYYVLDLQAGLSNFSGNQVLTQKWVAFALPDGVFVPNVEEVPGGVVPVKLYDGSNGLAVRIPDVTEMPDSKHVYPKIPLLGVPEESNPNLNLYLFNVDVESMTYEDLGQIKSQRNIDFSVMKETPTMDVEGSISGKAAFDAEKHYYMLDLNINAKNNMDVDLGETYVGFTLPEDIVVIQNEDTPSDLKPIQLEDGTVEYTVKIPVLQAGKEEGISYQIPVIGKTNEVVKSSTINVYQIDDSGYYPLGQMEGNVNIDLSDMDVAWTFDAESQIVKDFPDLEENLFGLRFAFTSQNLTIEDVDQVKVEFKVPENIKIHEPESYEGGEIPDSLKDFLDEGNGGSGNLDIEWDGNTALINLDTVKGTQWNQGFFTAFGESSDSIEDLRGLKVIVTLYKNGEEVVEEIEVPFEIVNYEGDPVDPEEPEDPKDPEEPEEPGEDPEDPTDPTDPENPEDPGKEDPKAPENPEDPGKEDPKDPENPEDPGKEDPKDPESPEDPGKEDPKDSDEPKDTEDPKDDSNTPAPEDSDDNDTWNGDGATLPNTATSMFTYILIGSMLALSGGVLMLFRRKRV